ncbi:hypothetical protein [Lysinibacillus sp. NPDC086135]|uniref:hypothetical protein n=1 Tax=Lysinibacillus sp. NPDC086135 TaxID=3364130 RepID=UPI0037F95627
MAKQMKKYITVTTASFMAMQLAACGNTETQTVKETTATIDNTTEENNTSTAGNGLQSVYDSDMANSCKKWKENDDGSFECLDENSPHYAHHFFNGLMYATTGAMIGSAIYKSRNLRNGTDREDKGGGSAVPRTNYSNTSDSKNANSNGITTNGSQNPSGTTSSSSNNSTTNSSNSNTSGSKSYSSGKRSYSNSSSSSTNSSNSYSNHSSSSTGKSGFGSGGASRGGSSSS